MTCKHCVATKSGQLIRVSNLKTPKCVHCGDKVPSTPEQTEKDFYITVTYGVSPKRYESKWFNIVTMDKDEDYVVEQFRKFYRHVKDQRKELHP